MKRVLAAYPLLRFSIAGFCAGIFSLLALILLVLLALWLFNLVFTTLSELTAARSAGSDLPISWRSFSLALRDSFINLARVLWDTRLGLLIVGILGLLAAWAYQLGAVISPTWARPASALVLALAMSFMTTTWIFAQWAQIAEWLAMSPELHLTRDLFASSLLVDLLVGCLLGLLAAAPLWALWQQAYEWLLRSTRQTPAMPPSPMLSTSSDFRHYHARLRDLKLGRPTDASTPPPPHPSRPLFPWITGRGLSLGLLLLLALALGSTWLMQNAYRRVAIRTEHRTFYLRAPNQPAVRLPLHLQPDARDLTIVNIDGAGSARLSLSGGIGCAETVRTLEPWVFERRQGVYLHQTVPLADLPPGDYCLDLQQQTGWGMFEYTLNHGGGRLSHQLALATGLSAATTLLVAVGLVGLALLRLGVITPAPYPQPGPLL